MKAAGWACAVGVPGWKIVEAEHPADRLVVLAMSQHAQEARMYLNTHALLAGGEPDVQ